MSQTRKDPYKRAAQLRFPFFFFFFFFEKHPSPVFWGTRSIKAVTERKSRKKKKKKKKTTTTTMMMMKKKKKTGTEKQKHGRRMMQGGGGGGGRRWRWKKERAGRGQRVEERVEEVEKEGREKETRQQAVKVPVEVKEDSEGARCCQGGG